MTEFVLDGRQTVVVAILVLFLGKALNRQIDFLRRYNISEPVTGGLVASVLLGLVYWLFSVRYQFSLVARDDLLVIFFTTIGLSSRLSTLLQGGRQLAILLVLAVMYLSLQNATGVAAALAMGLEPLVGVVGGSVALSGGHGTAIAWAPIFSDQYGVSAAAEIGIASATFGLVLGGVLGGPLARWLIARNRIEAPTTTAVPTVGVEHDADAIPIDYDHMLRAIFAILVAIGIGLRFNQAIANAGVELPVFVSCLMAGILISNLAPVILPGLKVPKPEHSRSLALVSEVSLGLFLAMSLMSLELWTLVELGPSILVMLLAQALVILLWAGFVVFRAMGADYDAAVMASGYAGLALGATPTAIANMTAVTKRFGASPRAFVIVPLIGAFFIDIANSFTIQAFIGWWT